MEARQDAKAIIHRKWNLIRTFLAYQCPSCLKCTSLRNRIACWKYLTQRNIEKCIPLRQNGRHEYSEGRIWFLEKLLLNFTSMIIYYFQRTNPTGTISFYEIISLMVAVTRVIWSYSDDARELRLAEERQVNIEGLDAENPLNRESRVVLFEYIQFYVLRPLNPAASIVYSDIISNTLAVTPYRITERELRLETERRQRQEQPGEGQQDGIEELAEEMRLFTEQQEYGTMEAILEELVGIPQESSQPQHENHFQIDDSDDSEDSDMGIDDSDESDREDLSRNDVLSNFEYVMKKPVQEILAHKSRRLKPPSYLKCRMFLNEIIGRQYVRAMREIDMIVLIDKAVPNIFYLEVPS